MIFPNCIIIYTPFKNIDKIVAKISKKSILSPPFYQEDIRITFQFLLVLVCVFLLYQNTESGVYSDAPYYFLSCTNAMHILYLQKNLDPRNLRKILLKNLYCAHAYFICTNIFSTNKFSCF